MQAAVVKRSGHSAACDDGNGQNDEGEKLKPGHGTSNPLRTTLAIKCSATAAKSQITAPRTNTQAAVWVPETL
jgi:hypothetical protein